MESVAKIIKEYVESLNLESKFLQLPLHIGGDWLWDLKVNDDFVIISPKIVTLRLVLGQVIVALVIYAIAMVIAYLFYHVAGHVIVFVPPQLVLLVLPAAVMYSMHRLKKGNYFEWFRDTNEVVLPRNDFKGGVDEIVAFQVLSRQDISSTCVLELLVYKNGTIIKYPILIFYEYKQLISIASSLATLLHKDLIHISVQCNDEITVHCKNSLGETINMNG